jgi:exonuclease III
VPSSRALALLPVLAANIAEWGPTAESFLSSCPCDIAALQEHRMREGKFESMRNKMAEMGWRSFMQPGAIGANGGTSAGVCIVVRQHFQVGRVLKVGEDGCTARVEGCSTWNMVVLRPKGCNLVLASVYLWTGQGL